MAQLLPPLPFVVTLACVLGACSGNSIGNGVATGGMAGATGGQDTGGRTPIGNGGAGAEGGSKPGNTGGAETSTTGGTGGAETSTTGGTSGASGDPEIIVEPTEDLMVDEANGTTTFTVVLGSPPTSDVAVGLSNSAEQELRLDPYTLAFTLGDWDEPQTVTLTGIDDPVADGDQPFVIITAPAVSDDPDYDGMNAPNVEGTVLDDDVASISIRGGQGLSTSEKGDEASVTIVLTSQPAADVTLPVSVSDDTEAAISVDAIAFTPQDWDQEQILTVTGLDDDEGDGDVSYEIVLGVSSSGDPDYDGLDPDDISAVNIDDDAPNVIVTPTEITTSEDGGDASFTVELTVAPTADVTIAISSSDPGEGTVSATSLVFTPDDRGSPQLVTVTGADDTEVDGDVEYTVDFEPAQSEDGAYDGLEIASVNATNLDDDAAGVVVSPTSGLQTSELGATATFTVVLGARPAADVTITLTSSDPDEGTVSPDSLVFTRSNWDEPQTVTITGEDDDEEDGPAPYTIVTEAEASGDAVYDGIEVDDVSVVNLDDELSTPAVLVSPTGGLQTSEAGDTATFNVVLATQPASAVGLTLIVGDTTEGSLDQTTLVFSTTTWSTPETITITGLDDGIDDGDVTWSISTVVVSNDEDYAALTVPDVSVTNADDDEVGITVSADDILETSETGDKTSFTVVLDCEPAATVTIPVSSSDLTEGTVSPSSLSFTASNWDVAQTVTVTGVNDTIVEDGGTAYTVLLGAATSTDPAYSGLDAKDVIVINLDNDPYVPCSNLDLIDDMEDNDLDICENGDRTGSWYAYNESTAGSQTLTPVLESREDGIVVMETTGSSISGWGATVGVSLNGPSLGTRLPYDVSDYTGIRFWIRRGPGSSYPSTVNVHIVQQNTANDEQGGTCVDSTTVKCSDHYADTISVSSTWQRYQLPFTGFYQVGWGKVFSRDLAHVLGFEFLIEYSSFDLMIDDLELY